MIGLSDFLSGIVIGLAITVPVGPMSVLCIQRALRWGALAGFATGLGAATVLVGYTTCVAVGFGPAVTVLIGGSRTVLCAVSAGLLLWLSARVLARSVSLTGSDTEDRGAFSSYCSAVACALLNPLTPALLAALLPAMTASTPAAASSMVAGVFSASVVWWLLVSGGAAMLRSRLNAQALNAINKASGYALGALAMVMAANAMNIRL